MLFGCSNFPNSATTQYKIINKAGTVVQDWTATGVTERVISAAANMSIYQIDIADTVIHTGFEGWIFWRTSDELYTASEVINLATAHLYYPTGLIVTDAGNTSSFFKTDLTSATDDVYKDCFLLFITGALKEQQKKITYYNGTTKFIRTSTAFTGIPAGSSGFKIINR